MPPAHITEAETEVARQTSEVFRGAEKFLDAALEKYGENSVVYVSIWLTINNEKTEKRIIQISFGSEHWTTTPEMFWAFLEVLLELKVPFVSLPISSLFSLSSER